MSNNEREAHRRVDEACALIRSAYRLASLTPADTLANVRMAIASGEEQYANDLADELRRDGAA